ncbi:MAG: hypothetical protein ACJ72T_08870, partial [Nitrososphaeraceae archaeon]
MGRWDDDRFSGFGDSGSSSSRRIRGKWNRIRIAKLVIKVGFVIIAMVFLSVFIPRYGLNTEIIQRSEGVGTIQTISIKVSNNNFEPINDVTIQFGDNGRIQRIGNMGPFSSVMITPDSQDMNFNKVIVKANNGKMESVK